MDLNPTRESDSTQIDQHVNAKHQHGSQGDTKRRRRSWIAAMIEGFPPIWFSICMNSGILAILTHQLPYQFNGLPVISTIFYVVDLVLFIVFTIIFVLRLIIYPKSVVASLGSDPDQLSFLACWPIAWLTLAAGTSLVVSQSEWGGHAFTLVAYVMWWFGAAWTFLTSILVYLILFRNKILTLSTIPPSILIPAVGVATVGSTGGLVAAYSFDISARLQVPIIIFAYIVLGQGIFLAFMVYAAFIVNLLVEGFPKTEKLPGLILLMGPTGQSATALQLLGSCASTSGAFASYNRGTFLQGSAAASLDSASIMLSMLLFGFGIFLLCISLVALFESLWKGEQKWTMAIWGTIFPMGTMNTAMLLYASAMDSPTWRVLTAGLLIILVIDYFICWGYTIYNSIWGDLLIPKETRKSDGKEV